MIKYMYITNDPKIAQIADANGVDRVWIDLEKNGKAERQKNMDSVKSHHSISDIKKVKSVLKKAELIVRINPYFDGSKDEINRVIFEGADFVMLPMFKTCDEAVKFIEAVDGRAKTILLLETKEAAQAVYEICKIDGVDEVHIGLNDLHLSYGKRFMFELLTDGEVERLCNVLKDRGIPYGFGGIARLNEGMLPAKHILAEHYRLGSTRAILSRSFCNYEIIKDIEEIERIFATGMRELRDYEQLLATETEGFFTSNRAVVEQEVSEIAQKLEKRKVVL